MAGVLAAAVAVAATCALIGWLNRPYPPHDTTPRTVDPARRLR